MPLTVQSKSAFSMPYLDAEIRRQEGKRFLAILAEHLKFGRRPNRNSDTQNKVPVTFPPDKSEPSISSLSPSTEQSVPEVMPAMASPSAQITNGTVASNLHDSAWAVQSELKLKFVNFPPMVTTKVVWDVFSREGAIAWIELYEFNGKPDGNGYVRFRPPPKRDFWRYGAYFANHPSWKEPRQLKLSVVEQKARLPVNDDTLKYPEEMTIVAESLEFGVKVEQHRMLSMHQITPISGLSISFTQNQVYREIGIKFPVRFRDDPAARSDQSLNRDNLYQFKISYTQRMEVYETYPEGTKDIVALIISVEAPPVFQRKYEEANSHTTDTLYWSNKDAWYRTTDILYDWSKAKNAPTSLKKDSLINIGRWTTYRLVFDLTKNDKKVYALMREALHDFNIEVQQCPDLQVSNAMNSPVWEYIDSPVTEPRNSMRFSAELLDLSVCHLPFEVRYQLEVCISEGWLSEYNLSNDFVRQLAELDKERAKILLEDVASHKRYIDRPMEIFNRAVTRPHSRRKIPHYCTYIRSANVTPTTIYFATSTLEISNRVIRHFAEHADRFLRVRFTDEKYKGKIYSTHKETMNELFTRVKRTMMNGITLGDRHYKFLAFGNSQFRENGAYFFCELPHLSASKIRKWMGNFESILVVAKYCARIGQCFSTTRAIHGARATIKELGDIESADKKHTFTDGVGTISKFLAQVAANEMGVLMPSGDPPSVMQFRLGGCKGVLAVWPHSQKRELHIRPSQYKFDAEYEGLEIIRWSQFAAAHLNRQLISVLTALGVPDDVFVTKLDQQLSSLSTAMTDESTALDLLQKEVDPNQMTLTIASMVLDGFHRTREPFLVSLLHLWRAFSIKFLKEKAKIAIHDGAVLLGCIDETAKLRGHYDDMQHGKSPQERLESLPEVFVQVSTGLNGRFKVIEGVMALARNPSLHPGDIRVVRGVDIPELHHLKDVVVLPQTGDRDVAGMCSGGDLDGDDFVVIWDQDLVPREWNHEPMDYTAPTPVPMDQNVTVDDITSFFVQYMKNDSLPTIANAHLATADQSTDGVKDLKCLELAKLHSKAVDYAKNGEPARMPPKLLPRKWPHFMEKRTKNQYKSQTALGKLYDRIELVNFVPEYNTPFDNRILEAFDTQKDMLESASRIKIRYDDAVQRIMTQHDIATEFEVWSTFVMHHAKQRKDFKFHEEIGQIATALKDTYREECYVQAGGRDFETIGPFVAAMYKVTNDEVVQALQERRLANAQLKAGQKETSSMPMVSFPWLFPAVLGNIATGKASDRMATNLAPLTSTISLSKKKQPPEQASQTSVVAEEDVLHTRGGLTHRGELLSLFQHGEEEQSPEEAGDSDGDDDHEEVVFIKPPEPSPYDLLDDLNQD